MDLDRAAFSDSVDRLVGLALEIDPRSVDPEQSRDVPDHLALAIGEFGPLADYGDVEIDDLESRSSNFRARRLDKEGRVLSFPRRVGVREGLSDIRHPERAEERVHDSMKDRVAIGMPDGAKRMVEPRATKDERATFASRRHGFEAMQVVTVADAKGRKRRAHAFFVAQTTPCTRQIPKWAP